MTAEHSIINKYWSKKLKFWIFCFFVGQIIANTSKIINYLQTLIKLTLATKRYIKDHSCEWIMKLVHIPIDHDDVNCNFTIRGNSLFRSK